MVLKSISKTNHQEINGLIKKFTALQAGQKVLYIDPNVWKDIPAKTVDWIKLLQVCTTCCY